MNPYEVMGLGHDADVVDIQSAYRNRAKVLHPDKPNGSEELFRELQQAYDILSNPRRRERYDQTGSINDSKATPDRVRKFIKLTMNAVIKARTNSGQTDDPTAENICAKIMGSMRNARRQLDNRIIGVQKELKRCEELTARFELNQGDQEDIVRIILEEEKKLVICELEECEDAKAINIEALAIFGKYSYKVGPGKEGQFNPGPTTQRTGFGMTNEEIRQLVLRRGLTNRTRSRNDLDV